MNYSIPFYPSSIMNGDKHPQVNVLESVRQNIHLMIYTKWPEESALKGFGSLIKKYHFIAPDNNMSFQKLKAKVQKEVKQSLKRSIELNEKRLIDVNVVARFVSISSNEEENKGISRTVPPYTNYLCINVQGKLIAYPDRIENIYNETIPIS